MQLCCSIQMLQNLQLFQSFFPSQHPVLPIHLTHALKHSSYSTTTVWPLATTYCHELNTSNQLTT